MEGLIKAELFWGKPTYVRGVAVSLQPFLTFTLDRCEWRGSCSSHYIRGAVFPIAHCITGWVDPILNALENGKNI